MPFTTAFAGLLLAVAIPTIEVPGPAGFIHVVNYSGQAVTLTVDDGEPRQMPHASINGYSARLQGGHLLKVATEEMSVQMHADLTAGAMARDAKGRGHWCFITAPRAGMGVRLAPLEQDQCADLVTAGNLGG